MKYNCQRFTITILVLALLSLACEAPVWAVPTVTPVPPTLVPTKVPTLQAVPTHATTPAWTAKVQRAQINVRNEPDGDPTGDYLTAGDTVTIVRCIKDDVIGEWCKVKEPADTDWKQPFAWVYRGCLSDNPRRLGCTAK